MLQALDWAKRITGSRDIMCLKKYYRKVCALYCYAKWWTGGWVQRHLARSDARRKQRRVVRTSGPDDELRHCVVREQHDFAASTQSIVHGLHAKLSSICLSICVSIYLSICLSIHPSISLHIYPSISLSIHLSIYLSVCLSRKMANWGTCAKTFGTFRQQTASAEQCSQFL